jgi:hypothetical protein
MSTPDATESTPARKGFAKPLLGIVLVAVALGAVGIGVVRESSKSGVAEAANAYTEQPQVVTVYYFHGETRCETCLAIESATERVVRGRFAEELAAGALRYEAVNYDTPAGRQFRDDYDLAFGSVVVQGVGETRPWENLAEVWSLVHDDPAKLEAYLVEHINLMLTGSG